MKFRTLMSFCLAAASFGAIAQTHVEGVEYFKADQFANARELLTRNFNNPGTDKAVANYYLGMLDMLGKDYASAAKYFDAGIAANPENAYNYVGLASIDLRKGNVKEAEANFKKAEKFSKKDAALETAIARAYYSAPDGATKYAKEIEKYLTKARKFDTYCPDIFIFEGDMAYDLNDANNAGAKYEMATTYNPKGADAYVKYANLFRKINPQYSIAMLQKLLQNNPSSALGQRELAKLYYDQQDYKNATLQYGNYVNNPSHFKQDEDMYSLLLFLNQEYKKGYDYATELIKENPDNFTARLYQFRNVAQIEDMKDKWLPIAESILTLHNANPKENKLATIDYNLVSDELTKAGKFDEARALLNEAIKDFPDNPSFIKLLSYTYLEEEDYPKTADVYAQYVAKLPNPAVGDLFQAGRFCYFAGVLDKDPVANRDKVNAYLNKAIDYANKAIAAFPDDYRSYKLRGDANILLTTDKAQQATVAADDYRKAISLIEAAGNAEKYANDYDYMQKYLGVK